MRIKQGPARPEKKRPREKLAELGPESLNDAELLSVILGTGYKDMNVDQLSRHLLAQFGSRGLLQFRKLEELQAETGLPPVKSCLLLAMGELLRRLQKRDDATFEVWVRPYHSPHSS